MVLSIAEIIKYAIAFFFLYATVFFLLLSLQNRNKIEEKPLPTSWRPLISVIIPAYNEEQTISRCIQSVLKANYPKEKLEIIVIDDGSRDETHVVVTKLKNNLKAGRIKIFRKENGGKAAALNFGLRKAKGEIIATLDADSYITKDAIMKMLPLFDSNDVAAVTAAVKVIGKHDAGFLRSMQKLEYLFIIFSRKILNFIDAVPVTPGPLSMFRSWVFKKLGDFDGTNLMEDQEMALRIQSANYRIRSSMDAEVFTEVPENFNDLLNQRVRWHRGGLRNNIKYANLISPAYGDFGLLMMPMTFISIFSLISIFLLSILYYFSSSFYYSSIVGIETFVLIISPFHVIGIVVAVLNLVWILWGLWIFKKEKISSIKLVFYMFVYLYIITIYWFIALIRELKAQKISWSG